MKIAFFSEVREPQVNGVVVTLARLTKYLRSQGHEVLSVVPQISGTAPIPGTVELRAVPFPLYPEMRVVLPHWSFHKEAFRQIADFNPDLVHIWTPGVLAFFGQKWARRTGRPVVASYETDMIRYLQYYGFGAFAPQVWRYFKWLYNNCSKTYVPSSDTKRFLEDRGIHDVEVFDRGVDVSLYQPQKRSDAVRSRYNVDADGILILYVGRMSKEKSLDVLLRQFIALSKEYPAVRLVLTGEGPLQNKFRRRFHHRHITFTGAKRGEDLAALFASADIFAIPSSTETLSLVSMEAMASGVPVLGMNAGGICDVVKHGETGLLAGSAEEFDKYLRRLVDDKSYRLTLGSRGRHHAEGRSWTQAMDRLEASYRELMPETQVCVS